MLTFITCLKMAHCGPPCSSKECLRRCCCFSSERRRRQQQAAAPSFRFAARHYSIGVATWEFVARAVHRNNTTASNLLQYLKGSENPNWFFGKQPWIKKNYRRPNRVLVMLLVCAPWSTARRRVLTVLFSTWSSFSDNSRFQKKICVNTSSDY